MKITLALLLAVGPAITQGTQAPAADLAAIAPVPAENRLSLAQALAIAGHQSPLIASAGYQVQSARENLNSQRAPLNPTFSFAGINNTVAPLSLGNAANYSVAAIIETSGRQGLRTRAAQAQLQQTQADSETTRLNVRQAVESAYIDLQAANAALDVEKDIYRLTSDLSDLTEKQFGLGAAPETNAIRARIALTQEEQNLLNAVNTVKEARANLNLQMGRPADEPVDSAEPLTYSPVAYRLQDLQAAALKNRPEIKSAEATTRQLQTVVGQQRAQWYPDVAVATDFAGTGVEAGIVMPLVDLGSIRGSVRRAQADVKAQEVQTEQVRRQVELDVESAYLNLQNSEKLVVSFQDGIVPRSATLLQKVEQGYKLGASSILDLIDAQQTDRSSRRDYEGAIANFRRAIAQLARAVGGILPPPTAGINAP
jgi:cobalt-zinc-cadmium efflux system outer membrane protein